MPTAMNAVQTEIALMIMDRVTRPPRQEAKDVSMAETVAVPELAR